MEKGQQLQDMNHKGIWIIGNKLKLVMLLNGNVEMSL